MLNKNGIGVMYCGKWLSKDQMKIKKALLLLKGSIKETKKIQLPANKGERNIIIIKQDESCPDFYPRKVGKPSKYPLGS